MSNIATTISQSRKLIELGLDPNSADMVWTTANPDLPMLLAYPIEDCNSWNDKVPSWSLSALLEVMPSFIDYKGQKLRLTIEKAGVWNVFYIGTQHRLNEIWFNGEYGDSVEPAYKMVCWLLEQGFIKKGGDQ